MATTTPNFGLRKPTNTDTVNVVTDIAGNMDLLDAHAHSGTYVARSERAVKTDGTVQDTVVNGGTATVVVSGHSQMYGHGGDNALPGVNGQVQTRSTNSPPEALAAALATMDANGYTLVNHAKTGETSALWLTDWVGTTHGDIELVWLDSNDIAITSAQFMTNFTAVLDEIIAGGSQPVIVGGHIIKDRTGTWQRQSRYDLARTLAVRYGCPFVDVTELLNALPSVEDVWTDTVHFTDAAFATIGTRLAALFGPKGVHPPKVGPGTKVAPNHQMMVGGTVTERSFAIQGRTIRLTAGETLTLPFDATAPVEPIVRYYVDETNGAGAARLRYCLTKSGIADRRATIALSNRGEATLGVGQRGHTYYGGPDLVFLTCVSGAVEVERIDFVAPLGNQDLARGTGSVKKVRSDLSGVVLAGTSLDGGTFPSATDFDHPFGGVDSDGTAESWRVDWHVLLAASGTQTVYVAANTLTSTTSQSIQTGYGLRRASGSADLTIRTFTAAGTTSDVTVAGVFSAGAAFDGLLSLAFDGTNLQAYVNNVAAGAAFAPTWSQYNAGMYAATGSTMLCRAATIQAGVNCV